MKHTLSSFPVHAFEAVKSSSVQKPCSLAVTSGLSPSLGERGEGTGGISVSNL